MSNVHKKNIGVLVSGEGTNLQAIIDAAEQGEISALIKVVISDNPEAFALERTRRNGIDAKIVERKNFDSRLKFEKEIVKTLKSHKVDLVCLAGFMRIIGKTILDAFPDRIMNIHPALLPSFPGLDAQKQAFDYGVKVTGCTVHFVDREVDHGPIICQESIPVREDDTDETLRKRILEKEHAIYPRAIQMFSEDRLKIENRRVYILPKNG